MFIIWSKYADAVGNDGKYYSNKSVLIQLLN